MRKLVLSLLLLGATSSTLGAQTPPRRQVVEEVRLDATEEDFPAIDRVSISAQGRIAVYVRQDQVLRLYDAQGKRTASFGRRGSGPGEFRAVQNMGWLGDTVWAYDNGLKRLAFVSNDGKLIRHETLPPSLNAGTTGNAGDPTSVTVLFSPIRLLGNGMTVAWADIGTGRNERGSITSESRIIVAGLDGSNRRLIGKPIAGVRTQVTIRDSEGRPHTAGVPFLTWPPMVYSDDGSRFGYLTHAFERRGGTYTVRVMKVSGDTLLSRTYPFAGEPIPTSLRDSAIAAIPLKKVGNLGLYPSGIGAKLQAEVSPLTPYVYRPVEHLILGRDNTIWLQMRESKDGVPVWSIDDRGTPTFSVMLPTNSRVVEGSRDALWVTQADEDGLPSLVRYRIK